MNSKQNDMEIARQRLRTAGLRATPARIAVLNLLGTLAKPGTHQEVSDELQSLGIDKSTIFRALNDLAGAGLARRMELGDHVWRYELATPAGKSDPPGQAHPHLLCIACGSITCLTDDDVEVHVSKSVGSVEDILLKGHCSDCTEDD